MDMPKNLFTITLLMIIGVAFYSFVATQCLATKNDDLEVKALPNGILKFPIQSRHAIRNVLFSRVNDTDILSINSNGTPHMYTKQYDNRINCNRSTDGHAVDILISNATFLDGGIFSAHVVTHHETFTKYYKVYIIEKPTIPHITWNYENSDTTTAVIRYARFTCSSESRTVPNNPDWLLHYQFLINDEEISERSDRQSRYMVRKNELMIAEISQDDDNLKVTCIVWEENGISIKISSHKVLHLPKIIEDDPGKHLEQKKTFEQTDCSCGCNTALTVSTVILFIIVCVLFCIIVLLCRRRQRKYTFYPDQSVTMELVTHNNSNV